MEKKLTIRESFRLGKGWHLMIFAILAMLVTNAGVNECSASGNRRGSGAEL